MKRPKLKINRLAVFDELIIARMRAGDLQGALDLEAMKLLGQKMKSNPMEFDRPFDEGFEMPAPMPVEFNNSSYLPAHYRQK